MTERVEALRRLADPGGAPSEARFLFDTGSCAEDGYGGERAVGEYEYGGEAIVKDWRQLWRLIESQDIERRRWKSAVQFFGWTESEE